GPDRLHDLAALHVDDGNRLIRLGFSALVGHVDEPPVRSGMHLYRGTSDVDARGGLPRGRVDDGDLVFVPQGDVDLLPVRREADLDRSLADLDPVGLLERGGVDDGYRPVFDIGYVDRLPVRAHPQAVRVVARRDLRDGFAVRESDHRDGVVAGIAHE